MDPVNDFDPMDTAGAHLMEDGGPESPSVYSGASISLPEFVNWRSSQFYDFKEQITHYEDLQSLDRTITTARMGLFRITEAINRTERDERLAKLNYERAFRRAYLGSTEKTDSAKRGRASLKCENLENEWLKHEQLKKELERMAYTMRAELTTLQTTANNLRQQLKQY